MMRKLPVLVLVAAICSPALGVPVVVQSVDTTSQDPLILYEQAHELGVGFPPSELISATFQETSYRPCQQNPDTSVPNIEVTIVNLTQVGWAGLVYVADPETTLANDDGLVNGELAFNIDNIGLNQPLIYEDKPNLIFDPGETWKFVIQDYANNRGLAASALGSVGLVGSFSGGDMISSGSIIPEPVTLPLLVLGGLAVLRRKST